MKKDHDDHYVIELVIATSEWAKHSNKSVTQIPHDCGYKLFHLNYSEWFQTGGFLLVVQNELSF